jgi:hypothetical protein
MSTSTPWNGSRSSARMVPAGPHVRLRWSEGSQASRDGWRNVMTAVIPPSHPLTRERVRHRAADDRRRAVRAHHQRHWRQLRLPAPCRIHQVDESVDDEAVLHLAYAEQVGPRPAFIAPDHRDNLAIELSDPAVWRPAGDVVLDCADILTSTCARALHRPCKGQPSTDSKHTTRAGAMSPARVAYGPVDETDGPRDEEQQY